MGIATTLFQWMGFGRYNTSPPALTNGQFSELQLDAAANLKVAVVSTVPQSTAYVSQITPGPTWTAFAATKRLYDLWGCNQGGSTLWVMVFDATSKPVDATPPIFPAVPVATDALFEIHFPNGYPFVNGCQVVISSTPATLTYSSGATFAMMAEKDV